jgi:DNA ligase (NAD+)
VKIGDTVILHKAGDIIPEIVRVLREMRTGQERDFRMPKICPICRSSVVRRDGEVAYYCENRKCFAQELERTIHFVSKKGFNIVGMGDGIVEQLMNEGVVISPADIFELEAGDLEPLERFAEKSAKKLIESINASKKIPLGRFIYALGIRHVGEQTSIDLAHHFRSIEKFMKFSLEELLDVNDVGVVVAKSVYDYFHDPDHLKFIEKLITLGVTTEMPKLSGGKLAGKTFVITGTLTSMSRDEAKDKIRALGGEVSETVGKNTTYLVVGENPGSKYEKAKKLGVSILDEEKFLKLLE